MVAAATRAGGDVYHLAKTLGVAIHGVSCLPPWMDVAAAGRLVLYADSLDAAGRTRAIVHGLACLAYAGEPAFACADVENFARKLAELLAV